MLDKTCVLETFIKEDTKVSPKRVKYSLGGPAAAALIVLSRLGVDCTLLASVGEDREGQLIIKKLAQEGIRLIGPKKGRTKVNTYLVNSKNGSRTGIKSEVVYRQIKKVPLDVLDETDVIIADRHEPKALSHAIVNKKPSTKLVIDPSTEVSEKTLSMIKNADLPIVPIEVLDILSKSGSRLENLKTLQKIASKTVVITAGEHGSLIFNGKKIELIPPLKIKAVDRLGAGDVYRAGIAWGALNNWDLIKCARYANVVSGLQCMRLGNGTAIPTKEEIETATRQPLFKFVRLEDIGLIPITKF